MFQEEFWRLLVAQPIMTLYQPIPLQYCVVDAMKNRSQNTSTSIRNWEHECEKSQRLSFVKTMYNNSKIKPSPIFGMTLP